MKTLCLLRHAHSDPAPSRDVDDHDRTLSARGEQEAQNVGAFMKEQRIVPDAMLCSSSLRTKETARIAFDVIFGSRNEVASRFTRDLYLAPPEIIVDEIRTADDDRSCLLVVGHNPGFEDLAEKLAQANGEMIGKFPPAAMAVFTCNTGKWRDFSARQAKLKLVFMP